MACFVASVEILAELCASGTVYGADVFDDAVDAGTQLGAFWNRAYADRSRDLEVAHKVDDHHFSAEREGHCRQRHGEKADGWMCKDRAAA